MKHLLTFAFFLAICLMSCKPSLPGDVISESDMVDILYDYHVARAMISDQDKEENEDAMYEGIFKKHGVTKEEFDSSMVYYVRHYRMLQSVYSKIEERMSKETMAMGGNVQDINTIGGDIVGSDTSNVWNQEVSMVFVPYVPNNLREFDIKVDTAFHKGDRFLLSFDVDFIVQSGRRDLVAMLAVTFTNDSVASNVQHFSSATHASLAVSDDERIGIKSLKGFIILNRDQDEAESTAKVAVLTNLKLIRMHTPEPEKAVPTAAKDEDGKVLDSDSTKAEKGDSIATDSDAQKTPLPATKHATPPKPAMMEERKAEPIQEKIENKTRK